MKLADIYNRTLKNEQNIIILIICYIIINELTNIKKNGHHRIGSITFKKNKSPSWIWEWFSILLGNNHEIIRKKKIKITNRISGSG